MSYRAHQLALWAGCLLLLLAAVMLVESESTASSGLSGQRLRVQEALASSAPCLTCHSAVTSASKVILDTRLTHTLVETAADTGAEVAPASSVQPNTKTENAHVRTRWLAVGARLLAVDARDLGLYSAAVDQFVTATEALGAVNDPAAEGQAVRALDAASALALALEQRANPVRLHSVEESPRSESAASVPAFSAPLLVAALAASLSGISATLFITRRREEAVEARPARLVWALRRRGPPMGMAACYLVEKRRLHRSWVHSPFFMV